MIFALGAAAFTYHVEGAGPHLPAGARLVQLIDDPNIAAWTPQGTSAVGSIRLGVLDLLAREPPRPREPPSRRAARRRASSLRRRCPLPSSCRRSPRSAIRRRSSWRRRRARGARCKSYLPILRSETFYTMDSGGLGWGMPAAVGVALGKPGAKVIGLIGDGSSMYSIQALVERRAARAADHVHRSQEPALRGAAGVRAGVRLRSGRAAARNRAARYRFRRAGARPGMPRREREPRAGSARRARSMRCRHPFRRSWKWTSPEPMHRRCRSPAHSHNRRRHHVDHFSS